MEISTLLSQELCAAKQSAGSKKKAVEVIAQLAAKKITTINGDELFQNLVNRERLGSTGIGQGIAIPHCRHQAITEPNGVCLTLSQAIDFDAIDNQPVDIVFAVLVPQDADESHLQALASIAEKLQDSRRLMRMRKASNDADLHIAVIE